MIPESYSIERVNVSALTAFSGNPRTHSNTQIDQIAASIREFGWTNPILVDAAGVILLASENAFKVAAESVQALGGAATAELTARVEQVARNGATPLVVLSAQADWHFLLTPVLTGTALIVATGWLVNRWRQPGSYPRYWW